MAQRVHLPVPGHSPDLLAIDSEATQIVLDLLAAYHWTAKRSGYLRCIAQVVSGQMCDQEQVYLLQIDHLDWADRGNGREEPIGF